MYEKRSAPLWIVAVLCCAAASATWAAEWGPALFRDAETLELRTIAPDEGEHWFPVWVVVVDDQVFVRLGSRAADRMRANQTGAQVAIRVDDAQFDDVTTEEAPEYAMRVADAMAEKYWSDIFVRYFAHPMTLRLAVAPGSSAPDAPQPE